MLKNAEGCLSVCWKALSRSHGRAYGYASNHRDDEEEACKSRRMRGTSGESCRRTFTTTTTKLIFLNRNTFLVRIVAELGGFIIGNASLRLKAIRNVWSTVQSIKAFALCPSGPLRVGLAPFLCYVGVVGLRKADISG